MKNIILGIIITTSFLNANILCDSYLDRYKTNKTKALKYSEYKEYIKTYTYMKSARDNLIDFMSDNSCTKEYDKVELDKINKEIESLHKLVETLNPSAYY